MKNIKMIKIICVSLLTLIFVGCNHLNTKEYIGKYTYGHEVEIFTDKKTEQVYWLYGNIETLNQYMKDLMSIENTPYPEVKIKIKGIDRGKATNGLAQDNDRTMEVKEYLIIE